MDAGSPSCVGEEQVGIACVRKEFMDCMGRASVCQSCCHFPAPEPDRCVACVPCVPELLEIVVSVRIFIFAQAVTKILSKVMEALELFYA